MMAPVFSVNFGPHFGVRFRKLEEKSALGDWEPGSLGAERRSQG